MPVINRVPHRNLILTGHMGVGKTAVARTIARQLDVEYYDLETEIEQREGQSAETIRELFGEARLRTLESQMVKELTLVRSAVIAVNGPTLLDAANLDMLHATGPVLCLTATLDEVLRRLHVARGANFHSPDVRSVALGRLKRERKILEIDLPHLDTTGLSVKIVAERAIQFWMQQSDT
jgi:shikimate kinase